MKSFLTLALSAFISISAWSQLSVVGMTEKEAIDHLQNQLSDLNLKKGDKIKINKDLSFVALNGEGLEIHLIESDKLCLGSLTKLEYSKENYTTLVEGFDSGYEYVSKGKFKQYQADIDMDVYYQVFNNGDKTLTYLLIGPVEVIDLLYPELSK